MRAKAQEYEVTTISDGKQVTQYFSNSSLYELIQNAIVSYYLWETTPVRKINVRPGGEEHWTRW